MPDSPLRIGRAPRVAHIAFWFSSLPSQILMPETCSRGVGKANHCS
jgi:hypothetical protein